jgi:putative heme-binding domain-containing protein
VSRAALPLQDVVPLELQPGNNEMLVRVHNDSEDCALFLHLRSLGGAVARLPEKLGTVSLAERLKSSGGNPTKIGPEFLRIDWTKAVAEGNAAKGRHLFGALSCAKCHAISADASVVGGPSLADARKRYTIADLVESILLPSKQVSPVFRASLIETKRGQLLTGLVIGETVEKIEILLPDATRKALAKSEIAERKLQEVSPMPQGIVKTPAELRDLLAYLLSEHPEPP